MGVFSLLGFAWLLQKPIKHSAWEFGFSGSIKTESKHHYVFYVYGLHLKYMYLLVALAAILHISKHVGQNLHRPC
ncbi:hypothetical protein DVA81_19380, partial [Acinetobacter baumannii]